MSSGKLFYTDTPSRHPPQSESPEEEELRSTLNSLSAELHKLDDIHWICPLMQCSEEVSGRYNLCYYVCERKSIILSQSNNQQQAGFTKTDFDYGLDRVHLQIDI